MITIELSAIDSTYTGILDLKGNSSKIIRCLKVGGNEKQCGSGRSQILDNGLGPWRSRFIFNLNMQFLSKMSYFLFRL